MSKPLTEIIKLHPGYDPYEGADDFYFNAELAQNKIDFIEKACVHVKGRWAGKPLLLEDWQKAIIANAFGWIHKLTGLRRYKEIFVYVPRKNGKTIISAAFAILGFYQDNEAGAEIYTCGFEKDQASLSWDMAKQMILRRPALNRRVKVLKSTRLVEKPDGSVFKPLSHEAESKHGFSTHMAVFDELHTYRNNDLIETITTSCGAREQPMLIYITTADFERENSPCNERHDYAHQVMLNPDFDPSFLPVVYEVDKDDDWTSPKVWAKANPNLGISISYDFLASECKKAQNRPSYTNTFKRLYLNIRTDQDIVWISSDNWKACYKPEITVEDLVGRTCYAGLDLASTRDLCALAYWFPELETILCRAWAPRASALARHEKKRGKYLEWAEQGYMTITPGNVANYNIIRQTILQDSEMYNIESIGVDKWNSNQIITDLTEDGFDVVPFSQNFGSMSSPTKELEVRVMGQHFNHMNNPLLTWCFGNLKILEDQNENIRPDKNKSTDKIDLMVAGIMALGMGMLGPSENTSVYEKGGLLTL